MSSNKLRKFKVGDLVRATTMVSSLDKGDIVTITCIEDGRPEDDRYWVGFVNRDSSVPLTARQGLEAYYANHCFELVRNELNGLDRELWDLETIGYRE